MRRTVIMVIAALAVFTATTHADDKAETAEIAKKSIDAIIVLLRDKALDESACKKKVEVELLKVFDLPLTAKLTLGRKYWPKLSEEERKTFQELFISNLVDTYFDKAKLFSDKKIVFEDPIKVKRKIHVPVHCMSKGEKIRITNKFYKSSKGWKVYDMEIQDISIVRSYGSQYAAILKEGTVADLLKQMRNVKPKDGQKKN
jgi:phospholipid transport system substrate-binding protein